jgi:hypothetical protein
MQVTQVYLDLLNETIDDFVDDEKSFTAYDITVFTREKKKIELKHSWVRDQIHKLPAIVDALNLDYERTVCNMYRCENCDCGQLFVREENDEIDACPSCLKASIEKKGQVIVYHPIAVDCSEYSLRHEQPNAPKRDLEFKQKNMDAYLNGDSTPLKDVISKLRKFHQNTMDAYLDGDSTPNCVTPTHPVLMRDGTWKPVGEVKVGDTLMPNSTVTNTSSSTVSLDYRNRLEISEELLLSIDLRAGQDAFIIPDPHKNTVQIVQSNAVAPNDSVVCTQKVDPSGKLLLPHRILNMAGMLSKNFEVKSFEKDGIAIVEISAQYERALCDFTE